MPGPDQRNWGEQPLHQWMEARQLSNQALLAHSSEQLTHKQLMRGRRGRWLTPSMRAKILLAANRWQQQHELDAKPLLEQDLFCYQHPSIPPHAR